MKFLQTLRRWVGIISKSINWLKTSYKKHPEFYLVLIFIGLFIISKFIIPWLNPESQGYDIGIFQVPIFAVIVLGIFITIAWLLYNQIFGRYARYTRNESKTDFERLTSWQKQIITNSVFFLLLLSLVLISRVLTL